MRSVRNNKILAKWFPIFCNHYYSPTRVCILVRVIESNTCMQQSLQDNDIFFIFATISMYKFTYYISLHYS